MITIELEIDDVVVKREDVLDADFRNKLKMYARCGENSCRPFKVFYRKMSKHHSAIPSGRHLTKEKKAEVISLFENNSMTLDEMSQAMKVSRITIQRTLNLIPAVNN